MGTTLTTLKTGRLNYVTVVAIEGYQYLLTDGSATAVATAWAGTDYAANTPLTGLELELQNRQSINPWSGLEGGGSGNATITLFADATDRLGIDVARSNAGAETYLTSTLTRTTTTIPVYSTTGFPSSGEMWIGNECIEYSAIGATSFTASVRGKYSPFGTSSTSSNPRFAQHHRAGFVDYSVNVEPAVTQYRRSWNGAMVGIWLHRVSNPLLGTLDTKAQAQCIYAGIIDEPIDDPDRNATVIKCVPFAERIRSAVLFRDQWKAKIEPGMWVDASSPNFLLEDYSGTTKRTTNALVVKTSGASGANEMNQGYYTVDQLITVIMKWLASEFSASRIFGQYQIGRVNMGTGMITRIRWRITGSSAVKWGLGLPGAVARLMGFADPNATVLNNNFVILASSTTGSTVYQSVDSQYQPLRNFVGSSQATLPRVLLSETAGTAIDQRNYLPPGYTDPSGYSGYTSPGLFQLGDGTLFLGDLRAYGSGYEIWIPTTNLHFDDIVTKLRAPDVYGNVEPIEVKQVLSLSGSASSIIKSLFYSTGSSAYNESTLDVLSFGAGLGIPWGLLGSAFELSIDAVLSTTPNMTVWLTKPTRFQELIDQDLVLLGMYLVWKNGGFVFSDFSMPLSTNSGGGTPLALTESNKAEQAGDRASHRTPTRLTTEWAKQIVKIEWGYDFLEDKYTRQPYIIEDRTAIDNCGQDIVTGSLKARNLDPADVPAAVDRLRGRLGFFTQPFHKIVRSLSLAQYEDLAPLDHVTITDDSARDPITGRRRVTARPALVLSHSSDFGGPGRGLSGEIQLWLAPVNRAAYYAPAAEQDETYTTGGYTRGYNSATKTLRVKDSAYSYSGGSVDATYFAAGDKIVWCEIDPSDPAAPDTGTDTVVSVSAPDIVLTTGFSPSASKVYRIFSQAYTSAQTSQQDKAYQADDADALIQDAAPPFRYELPYPAVGEPETIAQRAELMPTLAYGDGKARDTGHETGLIRAINQAIDYKTAHQMPAVDKIESYSSGTYTLSHIQMIYVGPQAPTFVSRSLSVAPMMRSTSGATATVRVTLSPAIPTDTSLADIILPAGSVSATFTTTSTTYVTSTAQDLNLSALGYSGVGFLLVELSSVAACRGVAKCLEGVRV